MNIVFIVMDTVRRDYLSPYNEDIECTENIQEIADSGTAFKEAVSQAPWTLPSHGSMFTGLYPWEHGATQTNFQLDVEKELLAEKLKKEGYNTACFSANPFISERLGTAAGFDKVETTIGLDGLGLSKKIDKAVKAFESTLDIGTIPKIEEWAQKASYKLNKRKTNETEELIDQAKDFIENNRDEDFFLFMNLMDCHLPLFPDEEYRRKHAEDVNPGEVCQYPHRLIASETEPEVEDLKKLYRAQMDYLDDQIGRLNSFLKDEGLDEETVVVLAGDHGENLGEDEMIGHSFSVSESLVNVPLIVKAPKMSSEDEFKQVELRELYNFILDQTGVKKSYELGVEYAKGGADTPEMDLAKIPSNMRDKYDEELYYVRTPEKKIIQSSKEDSEEVVLREGDEYRSSIVKKKAESLNGSFRTENSGKKIESMDEEIKNELKNLGYMQKE